MPVLQFKGKIAVESYHHTVAHHVLEFDPALSVFDKGEKPGLDGNVIIEGDNLRALKALLPTHAGKIKCIYIDPPYNTGNEGWIYNDNLTQPQFKEWIGEVVGKEGEDACRHDKWCCMMYPRLQLLKELLREDGAIFVSIDDIEVAHLRMIMDEVFGVENFLCTLAWEKRYSPPPDTKDFGWIHENILAYRRSEKFSRNLLPPTAEQLSRYKNPDNDPRGQWKAMDYTCRYSKAERPNLYYSIKHPYTGKLVWPNENRVWAFSKEQHEKNENDKAIWWGVRGDASVPAKKNFLSEVQGGMMPMSFLHYDEVGHTDEASKELNEVLPGLKMTPKPTRLIRHLVRIASGYDDVILDSFAGSGTTAHAVLALNKEDGGNRKVILVQQPFDTKENEKAKFNICKKITSERVRRVIKGYTYETQKRKKEKVAGLGGSFTYARLGPALFGEYRNFGEKPPSYEDLAKYIFYTETSRDFDRKGTDSKTGKIGEHGGAGYYLLYTPSEKENQPLDIKWLRSIASTDKNRNLVIYCEKNWIHRDDLAKFETDTKRKVRPMIVPFQLK